MHQMPDIANLRRAAQQLRTFAPDKAAELESRIG
jgi:hypothetical protein